eukprot:10176763-Alexandrium_andersonii.AAC.1
MARHGIAQHGTARHGIARHGIARHGTTLHGMASHRRREGDWGNGRTGERDEEGRRTTCEGFSVK